MPSYQRPTDKLVELMWMLTARRHSCRSCLRKLLFDWMMEPKKLDLTIFLSSWKSSLVARQEKSLMLSW